MPYSTETQITLNGWIATDPKLSACANGAARAAFRLAVPERRFDRVTAAWATAATSYYSVVCWRRLAEHAASSLGRGDPVIVVGRQRVVEWTKDGRQGTAVEVEAVSLGHDLRFGVTGYRPAARGQKERPEAAVAAADSAPAGGSGTADSRDVGSEGVGLAGGDSVPGGPAASAGRPGESADEWAINESASGAESTANAATSTDPAVRSTTRQERSRSTPPAPDAADAMARGTGEPRRGAARPRPRPLDARHGRDRDVPSGGIRPGPDRALAPSKL